MRVLLSTYEPHGDVELIVRRMEQLRSLGVEMLVCAPPDFAELLARAGAPLVPIGGQPLCARW